MSRKHKKKKGKIHKLVTLIKLLSVAALFKMKIDAVLQLIQTKLKIKFFVLALISVILQVLKFWADWKKWKHAEPLVHYESSHHQHTYDHADDHGGYDDGGHYGGHWDRTDNKPMTYQRENVDPQKLAYRGQQPAAPMLSSYQPYNNPQA